MKKSTVPKTFFRLLGILLPCLCLTKSLLGKDLAPYGFEAFFDTTRLIKIDLRIDPEDWNSLRVQHRSLVKTLRTDIPPSEQEKPFDYFPANITIDSTNIGKVAIRKKGFVGSLDHNRPSFKIQIDKYDKKKMFAGVDTLTLNNNKQDGSRIHQLIGFQLFRAAGLPASHCNLALVSLNGKSLGIYSNVESLDKHMFRRAFSNAKGTLYEGTVCDFQVDSLVRFERKFGSKKAISQIEKASVALNSDDELILNNLGKHLDLDRFYRYWAVEVLVGHWDGYVSNKNNYFVYFDKETDQLHFLPWGVDQLATDRNIFWRHGFDPPKSVKADAAIPRRLYKNPEARKHYFAAMQSLLSEVWNEDKLVKQIDDLQDMIKPHSVAKGYWGRPERHAGSLQKFINRRRTEILDEISDGKFPEWTLEPRELPPHIAKMADCSATFSIKMADSGKGNGRFAEVEAKAKVSLKFGEDSVPFDLPTVQLRRNGRHSVTLRFNRPEATGNDPEAVELTFPQPRLSLENPEESYRVDIFASPAQGQLFVSDSREPSGSLGGKVVLTRFGTKPGDKIEGHLESEVFKFLPQN